MNSLLSSLVVLGLVEDFVWAQQYTALPRCVPRSVCACSPGTGIVIWRCAGLCGVEGLQGMQGLNDRVCSYAIAREIADGRHGSRQGHHRDIASGVCVIISRCVAWYMRIHPLDARVCSARQVGSLNNSSRE